MSRANGGSRLLWACYAESNVCPEANRLGVKGFEGLGFKGLGFKGLRV